MQLENTKQMILDTALKQFAKRGYSPVSIRSLCKDIGIKESTVYYHFKNKQDILDTLVMEVETMAGQMNGMLTSAFGQIGSGLIEDEGFLRVANIYYRDFLNNDRIFQFVSILMIEQHSNPILGSLLGRLMFNEPVEQQSAYFALLTAWGYLKDLPARELAVAYQSIFYFCFCRQMAMGESVQQAQQELEKHLRFFLKQYKKEQL